MTDIRIIARRDRRARTRAANMRYGIAGAMCIYVIYAVAISRWLHAQHGAPIATIGLLFAALVAVAGAILWLIWRDQR